jgi:hypothetical protein
MKAAFPGLGAQQAAAFLMSLANYTESRPNIAVVSSPAAVSNAFGDFNNLTRQLKSTHGMSQSQAEAIVSDAQ